MKLLVVNLTAEVKPGDQKPVPGKASHLHIMLRAYVNNICIQLRNILNIVISTFTLS